MGFRAPDYGLHRDLFAGREYAHGLGDRMLTVAKGGGIDLLRRTGLRSRQNDLGPPIGARDTTGISHA